eukprot:TRINITY_DN86007_c0_g3_i1.p1 TRINITY_DN86007_c0_g3~~TRINITY_DN86007_c0_g3_i1.p1  ORF type:complete len:197 (-),score=25.44 TRINITY_DN86007_c0_g3_i1:435-1025(-)
MASQGASLGYNAREVELQKQDETLRNAREASKTGKRFTTRSGEVSYIDKEGVLMRRYQGPRDRVTQVCVPKGLRSSVMTLGHDIPMAGHLGTAKTKDRVFGSLYWPGMCADIRRYCQSCEQCQRTIDKGRVPRVPLVKMPLVKEPFGRVGMDIIGPIKPASEKGCQYILVMVDFATRYPEATPLRRITTESGRSSI